ncbi:hypothetical protein IUJ58_02765 [Priestia aryabhattai]|uniref:hypothetical protein n=1 Tax=Priestia aryabhattai TaxID=412384 RepID=UPI001C0B2F09|nr:hypothetical protein [Priestia aryabhattai]MBU3570029.1 hypothetical protein [Priestia aryabhattai]WDL87826.1 hypothetical protein IUJ58_02765 [Priestia aryabhattai]
MKKGKALALVSAFELLITGGVAEASTTYESYSKKIPAFNGSAYTGYQGMTGYDTTSETIDKTQLN